MSIKDFISQLQDIRKNKGTDPKITISMSDGGQTKEVSVSSTASQIIDLIRLYGMNLMDEKMEVLINEYNHLFEKNEEETPGPFKGYCTVGFTAKRADINVEKLLALVEDDEDNIDKVALIPLQYKGDWYKARFDFTIDKKEIDTINGIAEKCLNHILNSIHIQRIDSVSAHDINGKFIPLDGGNLANKYAAAFGIAPVQHGQSSVVEETCVCGDNGLSGCQCNPTMEASGTAVDPNHQPPRSSTAVDSTEGAPWAYYNTDPIPEGKAPLLWIIGIQETPDTAEYIIENVIAEPVVRDGRLLFHTNKSRYSMEESKIFGWRCTIVP